MIPLPSNSKCSLSSHKNVISRCKVVNKIFWSKHQEHTVARQISYKVVLPIQISQIRTIIYSIQWISSVAETNWIEIWWNLQEFSQFTFCIITWQPPRIITYVLSNSIFRLDLLLVDSQYDIQKIDFLFVLKWKLLWMQKNSEISSWLLTRFLSKFQFKYHFEKIALYLLQFYVLNFSVVLFERIFRIM